MGGGWGGKRLLAIADVIRRDKLKHFDLGINVGMFRNFM